MDLAELTLLYYLKNINKKILSIYFIILILIIISHFLYVFLFQKYKNDEMIINIPKKSSLIQISKILENNQITPSKVYPYILSRIMGYEKNLSFGEFYISNDDSLYNIIKKIRFAKNYLRKITIIEGFEIYQFNNLIKNSKLEIDQYKLDDYNIIAETFSYLKDENVNSFLIKLDKYTKDLFKNSTSKLLSQYTIDEIIVISSLVEKEAKNDKDRKIISSVIFNRLRENMKLDIDATVIYSITKGEYKLGRKLTYTDLKIESPYNTYKNKGIPPKPICIPGKKTVEIVLEDNKSPYYYYFFNKIKNIHIFSKNFEDHKKKLNEYRKKI